MTTCFAKLPAFLFNKKNKDLPFDGTETPNIRIITSVNGRVQRGIGRAQPNIGTASAIHMAIENDTPGYEQSIPLSGARVNVPQQYHQSSP